MKNALKRGLWPVCGSLGELERAEPLQKWWSGCKGDSFQRSVEGRTWYQIEEVVLVGVGGSQSWVHLFISVWTVCSAQVRGSLLSPVPLWTGGLLNWSQGFHLCFPLDLYSELWPREGSTSMFVPMSGPRRMACDMQITQERVYLLLCGCDAWFLKWNSLVHVRGQKACVGNPHLTSRWVGGYLKGATWTAREPWSVAEVLPLVLLCAGEAPFSSEDRLVRIPAEGLQLWLLTGLELSTWKSSLVRGSWGNPQGHLGGLGRGVD